MIVESIVGKQARAAMLEAQTANKRITDLGSGYQYKGAVDYASQLPYTGVEVGWLYTVRYASSSGTQADGRDYRCISIAPVEWEAASGSVTSGSWTNVSGLVKGATGLIQSAIPDVDFPSVDTTNGLQSQIDAITAASDVVDVVGTYQELLDYDTSALKLNDIVKVLEDSTHDNAISYYRWVVVNGDDEWDYIGSQGPFYTKAETDTLLSARQATVTANGILKGDGEGSISAAVENVDFVSPASLPTAVAATIAALGGARIATGTYKGDGNTGSSKRISIALDFTPRIVIVSRNEYISDSSGITLAIMLPCNQHTTNPQKKYWFYDSSTSAPVAFGIVSNSTVQLNETGIEWWTSSNAAAMMNTQNRQYGWIAIGL